MTRNASAGFPRLQTPGEDVHYNVELLFVYSVKMTGNKLSDQNVAGVIADFVISETVNFKSSAINCRLSCLGTWLFSLTWVNGHGQ